MIQLVLRIQKIQSIHQSFAEKFQIWFYEKKPVFETGILDHYKMFSTIMKLDFTREKF